MDSLGIDWSYRRAAWCSLNQAGVVVGEGAVRKRSGVRKSWEFQSRFTPKRALRRLVLGRSNVVPGTVVTPQDSVSGTLASARV